MNLLTPEQIAAVQKASLDVVYGLANNIVAGTKKLTELNLKTIRSTMTETHESALKACSTEDPQDWLTLQTAFDAPTAEKVQSYGGQLFKIVSATQAEFTHLAQTQYEAYNRRAHTLVEEVARSAPVGSEAAIAAWKSAIAATSTLVETLQKTSQQAVQVAESNLEAVARAASKTAQQASAGARR